ncbi:MAG TPA: HAD family hydrolase [Candidatus Acidoferrum sp.]|nr:HAD family hydrolase [Candidatus Acidoferrum sp.]
MPIKAVLFDMFDTIMMIRRNNDFYSPALMRMYRFLNQKGIDVSFETFEKVYIKTRDELYAKVDASLGEPHFNVRVYETLKSLEYDYEVSSSLVTEATDEFCDEFMTFVYLDQDAKTVLEALHEKYQLGIISNFAIPECIDKLLETHGLDEFLDVVVVSAAVNKRKPSKEIFENALKALSVSAEETVFVGDTLDADIEGAKGAGMRAVYIERRIQNESGHFKPDKTIKRLSELTSMLEEF